MSDARFGRLLRLVTILQSKAGRRAGDIAKEMNVSVRTFYRDRDALIHADMALHFDPEEKRYRILGDFFLPPVQLTLTEALAMSVLGSQVARRKQIPFLDDAWKAITKIRSQLPEAICRELSLANDHVHVETARVSPQEGSDEHFLTFRKAIAGTRKVRCCYAGGRSTGKQFLFRPYDLFFASVPGM